MKKEYSAMTLVGLGIIGMMAWTFVAPKLLSKPKVVAETPVAEVPVATVPAQIAPPVAVGVPNNLDPQAADDLNMNFAGVTFAENIPGMTYGFPMAGIV
jgi:hypothetical protein